MRMKRSRVKTLYFANRTVSKDFEGVTTVSYGTQFALEGEYNPMGSQEEIKMYGEKIKDMFTVRLQGNYTVTSANNVQTFHFGDHHIAIGDGMRFFSLLPDYEIVSIRAYKPLKLEVKKI